VVFPSFAVDDDWMGVLASHYAAARAAHPTDDLCLVFDIDGTILDLRHLMTHVLLAYDRDRGMDLFHGLVADDISVAENQVEALLESLSVPLEYREDLAAFYRLHLWDEDGVLAASAPYRGVLGVIRWFQIQPGTRVALNTGRPEKLRRITIDSMNAIGDAARVRFEPELLFMRGDGASVPDGKVAALDEIGAQGLRVVAVIDNEPENLAAMASTHPRDDILFLHADTMFDSQRREGLRVVEGTSYELGALISEDRLREHVELVWHGVNDAENLRQFLRSGITWAEVDLRRDPAGRFVLRHDAFDERPWNRDEHPLAARQAVTTLAANGRSVKFDVKEDDATLRMAFDLIDELGLGDDRVWFNAEIDVVGAAAFGAFRDRYPGARASCPIDFLTPLLAIAPEDADVVSDRLRSWGVTRLSVRWVNGVRRTIDELERRGWETNVYAVPDLQSFLEAAVLLPTSVTADFNFPAWRYFGRGSGEHGAVHRYEPLIDVG
jgi:phosphoglycolate phosphatase-like HAD superfamily hydrolase